MDTKTDKDKKPESDNTWWYVGIGLGVFSVLCLCVVVLVMFVGGKDSKNFSTDFIFKDSGSSFPEYLIIEHRYGDNMNPYDNLAHPPLPPPKPEMFGDNGDYMY